MTTATPPPEGNYVDIRTAADRLGVHVETLRRWDRKGTLTAVRLPNGHRRYLITELDKLLKDKVDAS
jgi:excisionase family DNA binding protein